MFVVDRCVPYEAELCNSALKAAKQEAITSATEHDNEMQTAYKLCRLYAMDKLFLS